MQVTLLVDGPLDTIEPPSAPTPAEAAAASAKSVEFSPSNAVDVLRAHFEYLAFLFQKLPPLSGLGASGFAYRDHIQVRPCTHACTQAATCRLHQRLHTHRVARVVCGKM